MEKVHARRGFLKGFGLLSAVVAGAATHHLANTGTSVAVRDPVNPVIEPPVDITHLAPLGKVNLTLSADNSPPPPPPPITNVQYYPGNIGMDFTPKGSGQTYMFASSGSTMTQQVLTVGPGTHVQEDKNNVKMSVGKDNRLWIEVDGQWRRVALEG